jgi:tetratricopeptide (TPR) repeat protein
MATLPTLPEDAVVRLVTQADAREFAVFLGAGASRSSGVPVASEMVAEWRARAYHEQGQTTSPLDEWLKHQSWHQDEGTEYSNLFEFLYPNARARQKYVETKIENAFPNWGYVYLANIIQSGHFNLIFTTNFDDLVAEALTRFLRYNPVICAAESDVETINTSTARAKIIKLHGDYLFKRLKNTVEELDQLDPVMAKKFREFSQQCGLLVLGYAGYDRSIIRILEDALQDPNSFPAGVYWGYRSDGAGRSKPIADLADVYPKRLRFFECPDFDVFMARLHAGLKLKTPLTIVDRLEGLRANFERLQQVSDLQRADPIISNDLAILGQQQSSVIGQAQDNAAIDLFEARIAIGRRDYKTALARIESYCARKPADADALTAWGTALHLRAEEEGAPTLFDQSVAKWREALRLDPNWLPARYEIARHFTMTQQQRDALVECEALAALAKNDLGLRKNLVNLYATAGRPEQALKLLDSLLKSEPGNTEMRLFRAMLLQQRGLVTEALAELRALAGAAPTNARVHFALASLLGQTGEQSNAAAEYIMAAELDPGSALYRIEAAKFLVACNQPWQALPLIEYAAQKEPQSAEARGWHAQILSSVGRLQEAIGEIEAALQLSPRDARILATAGEIYAQANQPALAEKYLRQAVAENMQALSAYASLAKLYWQQRRRQDYEATFQRIMQLNPMAAQQLQQYLQQPFQTPFQPPSPSSGNQGNQPPHWLSTLSKLLGS